MNKIILSACLLLLYASTVLAGLWGSTSTGTFDASTDKTITGNWTFTNPIISTGQTYDVGSWASWTFGGTQILTASGTSDNQIWPASKVISELAGKQATLVSGTNIKTVNSQDITGSGNITIDGSAPTVQAADPTAASADGWYAATGSGDIFYKSSAGLFTIAGTYAADPVTYSLTITPASFTGADKFTYGGTDYTAEQVITGLSVDASFTITPDTGRAITCAGAGLTDNTGGSYTANTDTADVEATCTSISSCASGTADSRTTFELSNNDSADWITDYGLGHTFQVSESGPLYSIRLPLTAVNAGGATYTMRWGTTNNLSISYLGESTLTISADGIAEFVMPTHAAISANTPYYWIIRRTSGSGNIGLERHTPASDYIYGNKVYAYSANWQATSADVTKVYLFEIKLCDL